jgi:hypothetical protein
VARSFKEEGGGVRRKAVMGNVSKQRQRNRPPWAYEDSFQYGSSAFNHGADMPKAKTKKPVKMPQAEYGRRLRKWYDKGRSV